MPRCCQLMHFVVVCIFFNIGSTAWYAGCEVVIPKRYPQQAAPAFLIPPAHLPMQLTLPEMSPKCPVQLAPVPAHRRLALPYRGGEISP